VTQISAASRAARAQSRRAANVPVTCCSTLRDEKKTIVARIEQISSLEVMPEIDRLPLRLPLPRQSELTVSSFDLRHAVPNNSSGLHCSGMTLRLEICSILRTIVFFSPRSVEQTRYWNISPLSRLRRAARDAGNLSHGLAQVGSSLKRRFVWANSKDNWNGRGRSFSAADICLSLILYLLSLDLYSNSPDKAHIKSLSLYGQVGRSLREARLREFIA